MIFKLFFLQAFIIILPGWVWGHLTDWKLWLSYLCFVLLFSSSIRRELIYGNFSDRKTDKQTQTKSGRLFYMVLLIGIVLSLWLSIYDYYHPIFDRAYWIALDYLGMVSMIAGVTLNFHAASILGEFYDRLSISSNHKLIKTGIYKILRHPIYTSYYLLFSGFCVFFQSPLGLAVLTLVFFVSYSNRIRIEEKMLLETFGEEYRLYMQQTWRFIPFIY